MGVANTLLPSNTGEIVPSLKEGVLLTISNYESPGFYRFLWGERGKIYYPPQTTAFGR